MDQAFDPYRKWLGIPAADQPAHHYRLLGIDLFETDADVISNASDGRMAQVKNYAVGKYAADSQRILNEIAAAKICLLDPRKKIEYDRQLQQRLEPKAGAESEAATNEGGIGTFDFAASAVASTRRTSRKAAKPKKPAWPIYAVIGLGFAAAGAVAFVFLQAGPAEDSRTTVNRAAAADSPSRPDPNSAAKSEPKPATRSAGQEGSEGRGSDCRHRPQDIAFQVCGDWRQTGSRIGGRRKRRQQQSCAVRDATGTRQSQSFSTTRAGTCRDG